MIGPAEEDTSLPAVRGGARRYAHDIPKIVFDYVAPPMNDVAARDALIEQCIARKPAAICLYVSEPRDETAEPSGDAFPSYVRDIHRNDILLVTIGRRLGDDPRVYAHVAVDWASAAEAVGGELTAIAGDKRSYLLLHERESSVEATRIAARFSVAARFEVAMTRLSEQRAAPRAAEQLEQMRAMLTQFPHAGLIVTLTPRLWLDPSLDTALDPRNRFVTLSSAPSLWGRLRRGEAAALAGPLHGEIGYAAAARVWAGMTAAEPFGRVELVPCELITPATLDDFARRYAESAGIPLEQLLPKE